LRKKPENSTTENMRDTYNGGKWTKGRFTSFVTSILRGGSRRWEPKYACLADSRTVKKINSKTGRLAQHFQCAACLDDFPAKEVQVDHIKEIGREKSWDEFIDGLYCESDNLQVLCIPCHKIKTLSEKPPKKEKKKK
jgi:5-methylcytosine-specific restriction endonuclease McrA